MAKERYCACPGCNTIFKLPDTKLTHRDGVVRCGDCRNVFNAKSNLVNRSGENFIPISETDTRSSFERALNHSDNPFNICRPKKVKNPFEETQSSSTPDQISNSGEDHKSRPKNADEPTSDSTGMDHDFMSEPNDDLDGLDNPVKQPAADNSISLTSKDEVVSESTQTPGYTLDPISRNGVGDYISDRPNPLALIIWFIITVGFVVLLGLQVKYYFVEKYAQHEDYRKYLVGFCKVAQCELPLRQDAHQYALTHTKIDLHPSQPGALRVTIKLVNEAKFAQPFPSLQLTLTDKVGRVVGRRTFSSEFYLPVGKPNMLGKGELGEVIFDLARPHEKAVGFVVDIVAESMSS